MKIKKLIWAVTTVILSAIILSSCSSSAKSLTNSLIGNWTSNRPFDHFEFHDDGTCYRTVRSGTFSVTEDKHLIIDIKTKDVTHEVYKYVDFDDKDYDDWESWTINDDVLYIGKMRYIRDSIN